MKKIISMFLAAAMLLTACSALADNGLTDALDSIGSLFSFLDDDDKNADKKEEKSGSSSELIDGMRAEFKEAMDAYEAFYVEYCEFFKEYDKDSSDLKYLMRYTELIKKEAEFSEAIDEWDGEMNKIELKYYNEVNLRVLMMLNEVM